MGNLQPRTLSVFKQPNRPQGTSSAKTWGVAWHLEQLFLTAPSCLHLPGETCLAQPTLRRCLWGPFEPRNTLLGKHVPEINSILASSQEQEHSRAVSMIEGQMRPGLSWAQEPWAAKEPTKLLRVHSTAEECELLPELHVRNVAWITRGFCFTTHQTALAGQGLTDLQGSSVGFRVGPDRLPRSHFQCHPPLFTDPQSPKLQTLGVKRAQEKGALVILPAHPRKPGQAWQHHSFRASLNALSKGTAVTTGLQVPGYEA